MNPSIQQQETPTAIRTKLDMLRLAIRRYVWLYGVAALFCAIGSAFWVSLVLDWFFEPPIAFRVAMQLAVAGTVLWLFYQTIIDRLRCPLTDANMALLLERQFPVLGDSLLTIIDPYSETAAEGSDLAAYLYQEAGNQASESVGSLDVRNVFDYKILRRNAIGAGILWVLIAIFVVACPGAAQVWAARVLGLSGELWPRETHLALVGVKDNTLKVAKGDDLKIVVTADTQMVVPETVQARRYMESGKRDEKTMTKEGEAVPGPGSYQFFTHTYHAVQEPFDLYIEGGDDDLGPIQVQVVKSPVVDSMTLHCTYPEYMERDPRDVKVINPMLIPLGTKIEVRGEAGKPLVAIQGELVSGDPKDKGKNQIPVTLEEENGYYFQCKLPRLVESAAYRFTLDDTDGIRGREPYVLNLIAVNDEKPVLPDDLDGIGPYITKNAYLPIRGLVTDDYGIAEVYYAFTINPEKKGEESEASEEASGGEESASNGPKAPEIHGRKQIFKLDENCPQEYLLDAKLDLKLQDGDDGKEFNDLQVRDPQTGEIKSIGLEPGQKLTVTVLAADRCTLGAGANVGLSNRRVLEVVHPKLLYVKLAAQQLVRRQRFESLINEVIKTQSILQSSKFIEDPSEKKDEEQDKEKAKKKKEDKEKENKDSIQKAKANCLQHAEEVRVIVDALENIRRQMIHNRLDKDTEQGKGDIQRLETGVILPLRGMIDSPSAALELDESSKINLSEGNFPGLEQAIDEILDHIDDPEAATKEQKVAEKKIQAVLDNMNLVLKDMIGKENIGELRAILDDIKNKVNGMDVEIEKEKLKELKGMLED